MSSLTHAVIVEVSEVCSPKAYLKEDIQIFTATTVGHLSKYVFEKFKVPFIGDEFSFQSILHTPVNAEAIQRISHSKIRIYGWCFEVNNIMPEAPVHTYIISANKNTHLRWYFGYAERVNHNWTEYCKPAFEATDEFICKKAEWPIYRNDEESQEIYFHHKQ